MTGVFVYFRTTRPSAGLVDEANAVLSTLAVEHGDVRLRFGGVSLDVPPGWHGRALPLDPVRAVLQVGNFDLGVPGNDDDPIKAMDGRDVLVTLAPGSERNELKAPPAIGEADFLRKASPRIPLGHAVAERSFCLDGRCLVLTVDLDARRHGRRSSVR